MTVQLELPFELLGRVSNVKSNLSKGLQRYFFTDQQISQYLAQNGRKLGLTYYHAAEAIHGILSPILDSDVNTYHATIARCRNDDCRRVDDLRHHLAPGYINELYLHTSNYFEQTYRDKQCENCGDNLVPQAIVVEHLDGKKVATRIKGEGSLLTKMDWVLTRRLLENIHGEDWLSQHLESLGYVKDTEYQIHNIDLEYPTKNGPILVEVQIAPIDIHKINEERYPHAAYREEVRREISSNRQSLEETPLFLSANRYLHLEKTLELPSDIVGIRILTRDVGEARDVARNISERYKTHVKRRLFDN